MTKVNGIPVDPLINVEVHMYFEVHNSDLWGGKDQSDIWKQVIVSAKTLL